MPGFGLVIVQSPAPHRIDADRESRRSGRQEGNRGFRRRRGGPCRQRHSAPLLSLQITLAGFARKTARAVLAGSSNVISGRLTMDSETPLDDVVVSCPRCGRRTLPRPSILPELQRYCVVCGEWRIDGVTGRLHLERTRDPGVRHGPH